MTAILFSPPNVEGVLHGLPKLASLIPEPSQEGIDSVAFAGVLRKTERELYRWIANTHYEHLLEPIAQLERVLGAGCTFANLLKTTSREQFVSESAEVFVADDLMRRGYSVSTVERADGKTPDLRVCGDDVDMVVEVYSPRVLRIVDTRLQEVGDLMQYVDVPASFTARVETRLEETSGPGPSWVDPWETEAMLDATRDAVLSQINADVEESLQKLRPFAKTYAHTDTPMLTTVEAIDVSRASRLGPQRYSTFSYPGFSGYSPAGVFRKVVERSQKKARKRQTGAVQAAARTLVVYLMKTNIADDLTRAEPHLNEAAKALEGIEPSDYGLDAITFVVRTLPCGLASILTVVDDATLTVEQVQAMFGPLT